MRRTLRNALLSATLALAAPAVAAGQVVLTLDEAMARARTSTPGARAMAAAVNEAAARIEQARSGFLPRIDVSESTQRGNQPVFAFSTLLSQRRFTPANFDIQSLNHPAPETNFRTAIVISQTIYNAVTPLTVRAARLAHDSTGLHQATGTQDLALNAARVFVRVLQLEASDRANTAAVAAAESDLERTRRRRDVGLVTDADVLAVEVHLADMRQRQVQTSGDLAVGRLELAEAAGLSLDASVVLTKPVVPALPSDPTSLGREALETRPEGRQAALRVRLAENERRLAQAAFIPRVGVEAGWEFNGSTWTEQRSGWIVGATIALNVFNGFSDRARVSEARQAMARATAEREQVERRIEVEIRGALARVTAAQAREAVGRAALMQARESQRIIRDRYDAGLASVTDVLRAAEAVLDAEARATAAETNVILETVALNRATGRL